LVADSERIDGCIRSRRKCVSRNGHWPLRSDPISGKRISQAKKKALSIFLDFDRRD
jgi:hypothetical protein